MPNNKEYLGTFYGMRLEKERDKEIRNIIKDMAKKKKITEVQLIFDYLEKGLNLNANKTINFNHEFLYDKFNLFKKNIYKKISSLEYQLFQKNYKKKLSLNTFIHNKYPEEFQRNEFYLILIQNQILSELTLLETFFSLKDKDSNKCIGYFSYLCYNEKIIDNSENFSNQLKNLERLLISKWYYKLITVNVVINMEDFYNFDFNFFALEDLIFEIYKGKKLKRSSKEERTKQLIELCDEKKNKTTIKWSISYHLDVLFKEIIQYYYDLPNFGQNISQDNYQLFFKIGYKPQLFYSIDIDFDGYINYLRDNNLRRVVSNCLARKIMFYSFLNEYCLFPPSDLILKIKYFFSFYDNLDKFIKELPSQLKKPHYSLNEVKKIAVHLYKITSESLPYWYQLMNEIPFEDLKTKFSTKPNNYDVVFDSIKTELMKYGINLDNIIENGKKRYRKIC